MASNVARRRRWSPRSRLESRLRPSLTEPSEPVRCGNPTLGRFDSGAAPLSRLRLPERARGHPRPTRLDVSRVRPKPLETAQRDSRMWRELWRGGPPRAERPRSSGSVALQPWALAGEWTIGRERVVLNQADGRIAFRFQARDASLVLSSEVEEAIPFRVLVDGERPGSSRRRRHRSAREWSPKRGVASISSFEHMTRSASGRLKSHSSNPAPRHTRSPLGRRRNPQVAQLQF